MKFFAFLLLAGCNPLAGSARDYFQHQWTCPAKRIRVIARDDLHASFPPQPPQPAPSPPPPDIAADPDRLRLWSKDHPAPPGPPACKMMEVRGCNQDQIVCCYFQYESLFGQGPPTSVLYCSTADATGFVANPNASLYE